MKKLYIIALFVISCALGASAYEMKLTDNAGALKPAALLKETNNLQHPLAVPTDSWKDIGTGVWYEALFPLSYDDVVSGLFWNVEIQESETTPGYYRLQPYNTTDCVLYQITGELSEEYVYVNATDASKVYVDGIVSPFSDLTYFVNNVTENGFDNAEGYGVLADDVITFPSGAFVFNRNGSWSSSDSDDQLKIALPGAKVNDYHLSLTAPYCETNNDVAITVKSGADIASLKYLLVKGIFESSTLINQTVAQTGETISKDVTTLHAPSDAEEGIYTALVVGLDNEDKVVAGAHAQFFVLNDDPDEWESYGTATYSEGILPYLFEDIDQEILSDIKVEQKVGLPGYFRLVNPYEKHSVVGGSKVSHDDHAHYLYINATNPGGVYVELSPCGFDYGSYGQGMVWSWAGKYIDGGMEPDEADFGTYEDNIITMPSASLLFAFSQYNSGRLMTTGRNFTVKISQSAGVDNIATEEGDETVEYYNLQGVRIDSPAAGQLVIKRQGATATKLLVK